MKQVYINNVSLSDKYKSTPGSSRRGTVLLSIENFAKKIGNPHAEDFSDDGLDGAGKVHVIWTITTPRGPAEIHDYWWNTKDELSICADTWYKMLWVKGWLKAHNIPCISGCIK